MAALRGESTNEMDLYLPGPDTHISAHATPLHDKESQFHQMLVNLVKNAMEAIDALASTGQALVPGPRVRIVAWSEADHVALDVTDNGIGVAPESMREIFTAGYTTKESGTGLGLHSAANFVVGSGGTIEPLSEGIGRGTTMRVRLRLPREAGRPGRPVRG
ncbi:MAG: ATP-binding protein [Acidobacteria bacterium]|nr:ATP-binding protein [Acidobacteriota bacterium]